MKRNNRPGTGGALLLVAAYLLLPTMAYGDENTPTLNPQLSAEIQALEKELAEERTEYANRPLLKHDGQDFRPQIQHYLKRCSAQIETDANAHYPMLLKGHRGTVKLSFEMVADGSVQTMKVAESSGNAAMDAAALRLLKLTTPCEPFPDELKSEIVRLSSVRTFHFGP
ncbi:energy transducer TonB family protein [Pseudomonas anguilliseptica]|uniref:energy transducer TonB family protein n=1 Tax=Pseudomonas anguilliseptica TaxID=53406 RepID=UPI0014288E32|nr:energy transducer TonB [Pseudomonas anguilliseptica]